MNDFNSGTQFDFTYAPGTSPEQILGFEMAGEVWSSLLADDVTVRIHVETTSELPDEVIGAALPGKKRKKDYKDVRKALGNDISSHEDKLAVDNLPFGDDGKEFSIVINGQELDKTKEFRLTNANAKSLGFSKDEADKLDGYILVNDLSGNSSVGWDYDALRSGGVSANNMDFLSMAMHEIGHVLGFVSGIDDNDWLNVLTESIEEDKEIKGKDFKFASVLDLYRYSRPDQSESNSSQKPGEIYYSDRIIDLSVGGNPYFSLDGGDTNLGEFANGQYTQFGGDGYQASHWKQDSNQGIMNPILPQGQRRDISDLDLTAFDVIGWDINTAAAPGWDELYENAVAGAETANIQERDKDVEKLVKESGYDLFRQPTRSTYSRYSRYSSISNFSFQLGEGWQFTTTDAVDTPDATEADTENTSIANTEPRVVAEIDSIGQVNTESEAIVKDSSTVAEPNIVADTSVVEIESNATAYINDDINQAEAEINESSNLENLELVDSDAIALDESMIEPVSEIVFDNDEINSLITTEPETELTEVENDSDINNFSALDSSQSLVNRNFNEAESEVTENLIEDSNHAIESVTPEAEYSNPHFWNNDNEIENSNWGSGSGSAHHTISQFVAGIANNEQDSLFS